MCTKSKYLCIDGKILLKLILKMCFCIWIGFIWLKVETTSGRNKETYLMQENTVVPVNKYLNINMSSITIARVEHRSSYWKLVWAVLYNYT